MKDSVKKPLTLALKLSISAALLLYLLHKIDLEDFLVASKEFPAWTTIPLLIFFIATTIIGSWRWKVFLNGHGMKQSIGEGIKLYLIGYFFNNFLPSGVGGDVVRGYRAGKKQQRIGDVYASIASERLMGLLATLFIALVFLPIVRPPSPIPLIVLILNAALWLGTILFVFLDYERILGKILMKLPMNIGQKILDFIDAIKHYKNDKIVLLKGFILSVLYQGSIITFVVLIALVCGESQIPITAFYVFVPLVWIISMIPISLNALGVREASFSYFFTLWGSTEAKGLLVSLIFLGISILSGIIGGIIWAISGHKEKALEI